jgi:RNA polymerase sigma-70 factor (ECF subfamily)
MEGAVLAPHLDATNGGLGRAAQAENPMFSALVTAHHADLLRVSYVILGDSHLAEDAAQSAWLKAWTKFDQLRDHGKVRSWLIAVAANEARQIARRRRLLSPLTGVHFGNDVSPQSADLALALSRLNPDERRLLALRYVAELTSDEIGEMLSISAGAVRHRLVRIMARLRSELSG